MIPQASSSRHRPLLAIVALAALAGLAASGCRAAGSVEPAAPLRIGTTERPIAPGEIHRYTVHVDRARALALELEQIGLDLELSAEGPGAERLAIDNPRGVYRPETLVWAARQPGPVTVTVRPLSSDGPAGSYRLRAEEPRAATREDFAAWRAYRWYQAGRGASGANRSAEAREAFSRAAALFREAGDERAEAWAWHKVGTSSKRDLGYLAGAEAAFARAARLERRLGGGWPLVTALLGLSGPLEQSDSPTAPYQALAHLQEAREIFERERIHDRALDLKLLLGEASASARIHRTHAALELYGRALDLARSTGDDARWCDAQLGIARVLRRSGDLSSALRACSECLERASGRLPGREAEMRVEIASMELDRERPRHALRHLLDVGDAESEAAGVEVRRLQDLGRAQARLGWNRAAQESFAQALERTNRNEDAFRISIDRAYAHHRAGDHRAAFEICAGVLAEARRSGDAIAIAGAHHCLARTLDGQGRPLEALRHIQAAVGQVEELRTTLAQDRLRSLFLASRREYYELYVSLLLDLADRRALGRPADRWREWAFEVSEASKARTLLDGLSRNEAEGDLDLDLLARKQRLETELETLELDLLAGGGSGAQSRDPSVSLDTIRRRHEDLDLLRGQLRAARPEWRETLAFETAPFTRVRDLLLADGATQIVSYFLGEEESYVWVLGRDATVVRRLPSRARVERQAEAVARGWRGARARHELDQVEAEAAALGEMILDPIADVLTADRLVLMKEGALVDVPFAALRIGRSPAAPYLVDRFSLVEAYSASTALALRRARPWRPQSNERVAVLGDSVYRCDDDRLAADVACGGEPGAGGDFGAAGAGTLALTDLPRLVASGEEARKVAALAADREPLLLLGFDAQADRLLRGELSAFAILHLAAHGFSEAAASGLVFSQLDPAGRAIDGVVREWQVYDLRLAADLVVLSACRTGQGSRLTGEGAASLSRAFLWAGASTVVVSLWNVDDEATSHLMERFYLELLTRGAPAAEALRRAQTAVRDQPRWSAPRYWAGFVVQGDWR